MKNSDLEIELKDLVMQTRAGHQPSYERLLARLTPFLRKAAGAQLSRFGRSQDAEDVVQETLIALHLKLHTYDASQPFLAWVRAVTTHKMIDFLRRARIRATVSLDDENSFYEPADPANPEAAIIARDLDILLKTLKPPAGDIVYALKVEGASVAEVAKRFSLSESNVKVIVHRALEKLSRGVAQKAEVTA